MKHKTKRVTEKFLYMRCAGILPTSTNTVNAFKQLRTSEIPLLLLLNFVKIIAQELLQKKSTTTPASLCEGQIYTNGNTKYLRHWVIWEINIFTNLYRTTDKKLLQLWIQHKCFFNYVRRLFDLWRSLSRLNALL